MRSNQKLILLTLSLLTFSVAACSNSGGTARSADVASTTSAMPSGMDHGSMSSGSMNMSLGPKNESFDLLFIDGMTPHHTGAIVMAQEALAKSQRPEIKQLAQSIIEAQQKEISQMKQWRQAWYPAAGDTAMMYDAQMGHTMPMSAEMKSSMMMNMNLGSADDQFDLRFLNAMIPHHQGALTMAKEALEKSDRPEVKQLAQNILTSQQSEIDQMNQWKKAWYGQ